MNTPSTETWYNRLLNEYNILLFTGIYIAIWTIAIVSIVVVLVTVNPYVVTTVLGLNGIFVFNYFHTVRKFRINLMKIIEMRLKIKALRGNFHESSTQHDYLMPILSASTHPFVSYISPMIVKYRSRLIDNYYALKLELSFHRGFIGWGFIMLRMLIFGRLFQPQTFRTILDDVQVNEWVGAIDSFINETIDTAIYDFQRCLNSSIKTWYLLGYTWTNSALFSEIEYFNGFALISLLEEIERKYDMVAYTVYTGTKEHTIIPTDGKYDQCVVIARKEKKVAIFLFCVEFLILLKKLGYSKANELLEMLKNLSKRNYMQTPFVTKSGIKIFRNDVSIQRIVVQSFSRVVYRTLVPQIRDLYKQREHKKRVFKLD